MNSISVSFDAGGDMYIYNLDAEIPFDTFARQARTLFGLLTAQLEVPCYLDQTSPHEFRVVLCEEQPTPRNIFDGDMASAASPYTGEAPPPEREYAYPPEPVAPSGGRQADAPAFGGQTPPPGSRDARAALDEALRLVTGPREHGVPPHTAFESLARVWRLILDNRHGEVDAETACLMMCGLKLQRASFPGRRNDDDLIDLIGYAALAFQVRHADA